MQIQDIHIKYTLNFRWILSAGVTLCINEILESSSLHLHFSRHLGPYHRLPAGPDQPHPLFIRVVVFVKELRQVNFETFTFEMCFRFRDPRLCEIVLSLTVNFEIRDSQSKLFVVVSNICYFHPYLWK